MSQLNWEGMSQKGIAGSDSATCFVAALDCLLEKVDIPYSIYDRYNIAFWHQYVYGPNRRTAKQVYQEVILAATGSICGKNLTGRRATTKSETSQVLQKALEGRKKVIIRVSAYHDVGLKPQKDGTWIMVGNSLPCDHNLESEDVFRYLYVPRRNKAPDLYNIYLIN